MKKHIVALLISAITTVGYSQDERVLMTIADDNVTVQEFLNIYNKNNTNNVVDKKTMEEYLDLFINFKLKVKEAESLGMDTAKKFINELGGYRNQLAQPYLTDKNLTEQLIQEAYDRMTQDVSAYHILVRVEANAAPADTLEALQKLKKLSTGIKTEADMLKVVDYIKGDNDESTIAESLGYFTAFSMVYPFETAAYNTEVGTLSKPVRTRFGYHVVFVRDKRPARGEIKVSHIFIRSNAEMTDEQRESAADRAKEIYQRIKNGESYDDLVKQYSEDKATSGKGGMLQWFGTGGTAPMFEDAAFSLKHKGDVSEPVLSSYGWHIIRREDKRDIGSFDEVKSSIKKRIEKDSRGLQGRQSLLNKLKVEYALTYNTKNRDKANKLVTEDYTKGEWKLDSEKAKALTANVLTITDNAYSKRTQHFTQQDYLNYLVKTQKRGGLVELLSKVLNDKWNSFVDDMLIEFENANLEAKYPEFKALMQEYHDGILLFDLMDQKVWSKAVKDTSGLEAYYESHKKDFMWGQRVDASIYECASEDVAKKTLKMAKSRVKKGYTDADIQNKMNESNPLNLSIRSGLFSKTDEEVVDSVPWEVGIHTAANTKGKTVYVQIYSVMEPKSKLLSESRGLVTSAYQSELEKQWIEELRSKYAYKVDRAVFDSINK
ncbi:MAG: peptidylprolyl isomerase [Flavobacteriales bacterium]